MPNRIVFRNGRVFDGTNPFRQATVVVDGACIAAIDAKPIPEQPGDRVVDLAGRSLMPGLISCHMHPDLGLSMQEEFDRGIRVGTERPPGVLMALAMRNCNTLLATGFTGYVGAACSNNIDAQLKLAIEEGLIPGPRIRACSSHIGTTADNNDQHVWWQSYRPPGSTDQFADGPEGLRKLVREQIRCGAEMVKIYSSGGHGTPLRRGMRNMSRDEVAEVVRTAHERGVPVRSHVVERELIEECLALGVDVIDHGDGMDEALLERMAKQGTFWAPSLAYTRSSLERGVQDGGAFQRAWDSVRKLLPRAHKGGVRLVLGDDYGGRSLPTGVGIYASEMAIYAAADVDPLHVLTWATRYGGELLAGEPGKVGVIEPGAFADLIVVDGQPDRDVSLFERPGTLHAVMRDGAFVKSLRFGAGQDQY